MSKSTLEVFLKKRWVKIPGKFSLRHNKKGLAGAEKYVYIYFRF